jgi:MFS family permease
LADRVGGKYPLLAGTVVGGLGFGLVIHAAAVSASVRDLIVPLAVIGMGQGLSMAPLFSMVMAGIPEDTVGAASGFVSAARSLGKALGTAVIGGVLQNQLAMAMHDQAVMFSAQLPPALRSRFVTALSSAVRGGARQLGSAAPSGNDQLCGLAHEVVTHAYVEAMVPTLAVGLMAVALATLGSLAMANVRGARREP